MEMNRTPVDEYIEQGEDFYRKTSLMSLDLDLDGFGREEKKAFQGEGKGRVRHTVCPDCGMAYRPFDDCCPWCG